MAKTIDMDGSQSSSISDRQEKKKKKPTLWESMKKIKPSLKDIQAKKKNRIQNILKDI